MKLTLLKMILTAIVVGSVSILSTAQTTKENLRREIVAQQQSKERAAQIFFNIRLSDEQRLNAANQVGTFNGDNQLDQAKRIVLNVKESDEIRGSAMVRAVSALKTDEKYASYLMSLIRNPQSSPALRQQGLVTFQLLSFSRPSSSLMDEFGEVMRSLTSDANQGFKEAAFSWLIARKDDMAYRVLIKAIDERDVSVLPLDRCLDLLSINPTPDAYASVYQVLKSRTPDSIRVQAVRLLGKYEPARRDLVSIMQDKSSSEDLRLVAMGTLSANITDSFPQYVLPIIQDKTESKNLVAHAIRAEMYRRSSAIQKGRNAADFDTAVQNLAGSSSSSEVRSLSTQYINTVGPKK